MINEEAQKAFDVPLVDYGIANSIEVCLENIGCPTSTNTPFLAGFLLDLDQSSADLSVNESIETLYQIDVSYASHLGSSPINKELDKLADIFSIGSTHSFNGECFTVDSLSASGIRVGRGWGTKSLTLTVSGYTPRL